MDKKAYRLKDKFKFLCLRVQEFGEVSFLGFGRSVIVRSINTCYGVRFAFFFSESESKAVFSFASDDLEKRDYFYYRIFEDFLRSIGAWNEFVEYDLKGFDYEK